MNENGSAAFGGTLDSLVGRRTVKSRCPICDGVIDSVPIKYGVKAMMACPHCATMVVLEVEDTPNSVIKPTSEKA
jgi:hypothetical protein